LPFTRPAHRSHVSDYDFLPVYPNINVVEETANLKEAVQAVRATKSVLIFLDSQMPDGELFEF
jgi:DNA-binding NarL/FixJ family response regulator